MSWDAEPVVGQWYRHLEKDYEFKVVAVDEDEGIVQIQYIDDEVEELDIDSWYEWDIEPIVPYDKSIRTSEGITTDDDVDPESDRYADSLDDEPGDGDDELDGWEDRRAHYRGLGEFAILALFGVFPRNAEWAEGKLFEFLAS